MPFEQIQLKSRFVVAFLFAITGAAVMFAILVSEHATMFRHDGLVAIACAAVGAGAAGFLLAPLMGLLRNTGLSWSVFAAGSATLLGAAFGATIFVIIATEFGMFPLAVIFGPVFVTVGLVNSLAGPIWLLCVLVMHNLTQAVRLRDALLPSPEGL